MAALAVQAAFAALQRARKRPAVGVVQALVRARCVGGRAVVCLHGVLVHAALSPHRGRKLVHRITRARKLSNSTGWVWDSFDCMAANVGDVVERKPAAICPHVYALVCARRLRFADQTLEVREALAQVSPFVIQHSVEVASRIIPAFPVV